MNTMNNRRFDPLPTPPPKPEFERLTFRGKRHEGALNNVCCAHFKSKECHDVAGHCADGCKWEEAVWERLAQYEETCLTPQQLKKLIPAKVEHGATIYQCGTCPSCRNVVNEFEKWGEQSVHITVPYCKFCGQALDWEGFSTEPPKKTASFCPNHVSEDGTCYFDRSYHCDYVELCKFKTKHPSVVRRKRVPPSGSNAPDA